MSAGSTTRVAVACQGGGSHTAFTAGALARILRDRPAEYELSALSGASGGAICATLAWDGLRRDDPEGASDALEGFWNDLAAANPIERFANGAFVSGARVTREFGAVSVSPYATFGSDLTKAYLRRLVDRYVDLERAADEGPPPDLYVSAVDVRNGEFTVFENGEGGLDALLASSAVPTLFEAHPVDGEYYWDGLFSQNPPIRHFTVGADVEEKPDEIWIVRISPRRRDAVPRSVTGILDRRIELAGNLSLEQEIHTIQLVNRLIDGGALVDDSYKPIAVKRIQLELDLDVHSKFDRDPAFVDSLLSRGAEHAAEFWEGDASVDERVVTDVLT